MTTFVQASATGEGFAFIDGGVHHPVIYVLYEVLAFDNPKVRVTGSTFPRRLQFAGSLQLTTGDLDHAGTHFSVPVDDWPVAWEMAEHDTVMRNFTIPICDGIHWLLPPSVELRIEVGW